MLPGSAPAAIRAPGTVVPIFSPPDELTPGGHALLDRMGADNRTFAAALVDMGVRGHVRMVEEDGGWFSRDKTRIERLPPQPLPPDEEAALRDALRDRRIDRDGAEESREILGCEEELG